MRNTMAAVTLSVLREPLIPETLPLTIVLPHGGFMPVDKIRNTAKIAAGGFHDFLYV